MKSKAWTEKVMQGVIFIAACASVLAVALICIFLFANGIPAIRQIGFVKFITGDIWRPGNELFGIFPMIIGSIYVTAGAIIFGVPIGILTSVFMAMYCPKKIYKPLKAATELLAGIPSVVYGFFGMAVVVPAIRNYLLPLWKLISPDTATSGFSVLAGAIILAIMILPTIVSMSENAIRAVPPEFREASLALGADKRETISKVIVPAAKSGIFSSIILAMGRAIGETMAVLMVTGNVAKVPGSAFDPAATLTGTIAMEWSYASPEHQSALFAVGIILFVIIVILNGIAQALMKRLGGMHA